MKLNNRLKLERLGKRLENICEEFEAISNDEEETDPAAAAQILMIKDYIQEQTEELNEFIESE